MAVLTVDGQDLVVDLAWWERLAAGTGRIRIPLAAVESVTATRQPWRLLRGTRERGLLIPGRLCAGIWRHSRGRDLVALRPFGASAVGIDLRPPAPYARIAAHTTRAPQTAADLRTAIRRATPTATHQAPAPEAPAAPPAPPGRTGRRRVPGPVAAHA
ncbi:MULTISPECIES: hypothetical protein [unclassified Kitasatospora]|uniref:hypothetical protein n=1 Tax=unclassified Kitasatospora TaxID=2633591 RepID=UPI0033FD4D13